MAFWDELKEKITQGSQEALQKTKDIADVVTMNADISESKRKIRELYGELGEMLVSEAFEGMTSQQITRILEEETADDSSRVIVLRNWKEIYSTVRFVKSEEEVIAINEARISDLKSEGKCPNCGSRIMKGMSFCPECGTRIMKPSPQQEGESAGQQDAAAPESDETASGTDSAPKA